MNWSNCLLRLYHHLHLQYHLFLHLHLLLLLSRLRFRSDGKCSSLLGELYTCHRLAKMFYRRRGRRVACETERETNGSCDSTMKGKIVEKIFYIQKLWAIEKPFLARLGEMEMGEMVFSSREGVSSVKCQLAIVMMLRVKGVKGASGLVVVSD